MSPKSRRKKSRLFSSKPAGKAKGKSRQGTLINSAIAVLSLFLIAFIFSFSQRTAHKGIPIEVTFPALPDPETAEELYIPPTFDIEVEVLNGCGQSGLAGTLSNHLRVNDIDVVRSENADHFEYTETMVILRNEHLPHLRQVTKVLGMEESDLRVKKQPDESSDVSITLIIGKDFSSIEPFRNAADISF